MDSRPPVLGATKARPHRLNRRRWTDVSCLDLGNGTFTSSHVTTHDTKYSYTPQIRVRNYNRNVLVTDPTDWDEPRFGWIFVLFIMNWVFSVSHRPSSVSHLV